MTQNIRKAEGTLRYSVKREGGEQNWWIVLDCDPVLGDYYRHLYLLANHRCEKLQRPFWGAHITVSRNEEPCGDFKCRWMKYEGEKVEFTYVPGVKDNYSPDRYRSFFWLDVKSPRLMEVRQELGLGAPSCGFHLTIGSQENPDNKDWYLETFKKNA
jgi:hypothetical protein